MINSFMHRNNAEQNQNNGNRLARAKKSAMVAAALLLAACSPSNDKVAAEAPSVEAVATATPTPAAAETKQATSAPKPKVTPRSEVIYKAKPTPTPEATATGMSQEQLRELNTTVEATAKHFAKSNAQEYEKGNSEVQEIVYPNGTEGSSPLAEVTIQKTEQSDDYDHITTVAVATMPTTGEARGNDFVPQKASKFEFSRIAYKLSTDSPDFDKPENMVLLDSFTLAKTEHSWTIDSTTLTNDGSYDRVRGNTANSSNTMTPESFEMISGAVEEKYSHALQLPDSYDS